MANIKIDELAKDLSELQRLLAQSERQRTTDLLSIEIRKVETELATLRAELPSPTAATPKPAVATQQQPKRYLMELNQYAFDQSDKFVKLFVTLDGVQKCTEENVQVTFTESSIELKVIDLNNRDYQLKINNLLAAIDVAKSHRKVKPDMVIIYAKKAKEAVKWTDLTVVEKRVRESKVAAMEPDKDLSSSDPSSGLMNIMQKMYDSGDSEMKKLISMAWTEGEEKRRAGLE